MNPPRQAKRVRRNFARRTAAYTLFEIMLVLGIISVLVSAAIYMLAGNLEAARLQRVEADLQAIDTQLKTYEMMNFDMPTTEQGLAALVNRPTSGPEPRKWIRLLNAVPVDPWNNPYQYVNPGQKNPSGYDLYSLGPDKKVSDDDIYSTSR